MHTQTSVPSTYICPAGAQSPAAGYVGPAEAGPRVAALGAARGAIGMYYNCTHRMGWTPNDQSIPQRMQESTAETKNTKFRQATTSHGTPA